jgi:hypothetical protein
MDGRSDRGALWKKVVIAGVVGLLYLYLANRAHPTFSLREVIEGVVKFILLMWGGISPGVRAFFLDILLFIAAFILWAAFFSQFTLPLQNFGQRLLAAIYLIRYSVGMHGPAISIQDGEVPSSYPKDRPHPPGVIVLDAASAAVLRTRSRFTRSVGPGLVFTRAGEYLAGAVDLHRKASHKPALGPLREEEDPFAAWDEKKEPREAYEKRQERRFATSGETRDGVEVVPMIYTNARLYPNLESSADKGLNNSDNLMPNLLSETVSKFGYNPEAVRRAITGEAVDPNVVKPWVDKAHVPWYELPAYLAVDLWREYLHRFTFEQLFAELDDYNGKTAVQVIQQSVKQRLTELYVDEIDSVGKPTGKYTRSREFELLHGRGIRVLDVHIRNLRFEKKIDQQLEDKWVSYWYQRAEAEREYLIRRRSYSSHAGEKDAQREFAYIATRKIDEKFLKSPKTSSRFSKDQMREALERLLRGTLTQCVQDPDLHQRLSGEETEIIQIINWLRRQ